MNRAKVLVREVIREYERVQEILEPQVRAAVASDPRSLDLEVSLGVVVTQNTLFPCLGAAMNEAMPQTQDYFVELATRLACYVLTAMHPDDQQIAAVRVQAGLLDKLGHMQAEGYGLRGGWGPADDPTRGRGQ